MSCILVATGVVVAYVAHLSELTEQTFSPRDLITGRALPNRSFIMVSLAVGFALFVAFGLLMLTVYLEIESGLFVLFLLAATFLGYFVFLCRWGTVFPAAVIEGNWSLRDAYERGRHTFWKLMGQLLGGAVIATYAVNRIEALLARQGYENFVWTDIGTVTASGTILALASSLAHIFVTLLGVSAFCNAYRYADECRNTA